MLQNQKHKFSLPSDLTYFNVAYMSPLLKVAEVQGMAALMKKGNPTLMGMTDFFDDIEKLKTTFGQIINAPTSQIAVIPSVSYGVANAVKNLKYKPGGNIICLSEQFPSNYYPWERAAQEQSQELCVIGPSKDTSERISSWNQNIIDAINPNTTAVCLCHVHWADGSLFDLKKISKACQKNEAYLIIDGTQSVGALPLRLNEVPFDALIVGGYKWLLGHYGMGMAFYSEKFDTGIPIEENWINKIDSENFQGLVNYKNEYKAGAAKYSVGEQSNFIHKAILQAGMEQILEWGVENIQAYCKNLHEVLLSELNGTPFVIPKTGESSSHLTSIRISPSLNMENIKQVLQQNNIHVSYRGDAIRVSFYVFNSEEEVKGMTEILRALV